MNQIFGYEILPDDHPQNNFDFEGTQEILLNPDLNSESTQLRFFAQPNTSLAYCYSDKYKAYVYIWGIPAHPSISSSDIPEWCISVTAEQRFELFRELIGTFVIVIDKPEQHQLTFVTDILGIRPMFLGKYKNRIVFGSDVWSIQKAGLSNGVIDYDAVSAWVAYGYNCTDGTLFSDLHRLPPGSAVILENNNRTEIQYAQFESKSDSPKIDQVSEEVHHIVESSFKTLLRGHQQTFLTLSGGYDSRYLLALALLHNEKSVECATVSFSKEEGYVAHQVAEIMGVPLRTYNVNGSTWNLYDEVYHFMADGFPISKFVIYRVAQDYPGINMINGFMGDTLIRGDSDRYMDKYETEWDESLVDVLQRKHTKLSFKLLRKDMAKKIQMRSRPPMEKAVREGTRLGKVFGWQDYYYTHRFYISNNFLQHINLSESLIPFYNWLLLSYKMEHDYKVFTLETYRGIFRKYFSKLSDIPRSSDMKPKKRVPSPTARCTKQWAHQILPVLMSNKRLSLLQKRLCIPLDIAGITGLRKSEFAIFAFKRLYLLEEEVRGAGLDFDWDFI